MKCRPFQHFEGPSWRSNRSKSAGMLLRVFNIFTTVLLMLLVGACASHRAPTSSLQQPPSQRIKYHIVSRGETLYSIAWRYGKDFRQLAATNGIAPPYQIFPGQRLTLASRFVAAAPVAAPKKKYTAPHKPSRPATRTVAKTAKSLTPSTPKKTVTRISSSGIRWRWPARGKVISSFQARNPLRKGVDIAGEKGDSVLAAANGTVIYAGSALRGYGKLLIVKHNDEYLSAYAHNDKLLVGEGSEVKAGQRIAELGSSGTDRNKLHFEIRHNGQPVDPLAYLP